MEDVYCILLFADIINVSCQRQQIMEERKEWYWKEIFQLVLIETV